MKQQLSYDSNDTVLVVYTHGWRNHAESRNLTTFRNLLQHVWLRDEAEGTGIKASGRRLIGIYLSWDGMTFRGSILGLLSFWDRQEAVSRIAQGAVREVLEEVHVWRYSGTRPGETLVGPGRRLIVLGHSFGGALTFRALSQSLFGIVADTKALRPPADLVLLINPALSATAYLPLHLAIQAKPPLRGGYPFQMLIVTARNDWQVGLTFRIAHLWRRIRESARDEHEKLAMRRGVGFMTSFRTHFLVRSPVGLAARRRKPRMLQRWRQWTGPEAAWTLLKSSRSGPLSPLFTVAIAHPAIVNGHGGISRPVFIRWFRQIVLSTG